MRWLFMLICPANNHNNKVQLSMTRNTSRNLDWLVAARGYAMFGVFLGHVMLSYINDHGYVQLIGPGQYMEPMFVPFFAILAGAFYQRSGSGFFDYARLKFGQRMLPVYFYLLLIIPFYLFLPPPDKTAMDSLQYAPLHLLGIPWISWPSWFLVALFTAELMYYFIYPHASSRLRITVMAVTCYSLAWLYNHFKTAVPVMIVPGMFWMLHAALLFCAWFLIGMVVRPYLLKMTRWPRWQVLLLGLGAALVCRASVAMNTITAADTGIEFIDTVFSGQMIAISVGQYGHYLWFFLATLTAALTMLCISRLIPVSRFMRACGDQSLLLLGLNGIFFHCLNIRITGMFIPADPTTGVLMLYSIILAALSMAVCLPAAVVLSRWLPQLTGKPMLKGPFLPALYRKRR